MLGDVLRWKRPAGQESTVLPYAPPGRLTTKPQRHRHVTFTFPLVVYGKQGIGRLA